LATIVGVSLAIAGIRETDATGASIEPAGFSRSRIADRDERGWSFVCRLPLRATRDRVTLEIVVGSHGDLDKEPSDRRPRRDDRKGETTRLGLRLVLTHVRLSATISWPHARLEESGRDPSATKHGRV
jgi:hypothetical protein